MRAGAVVLAAALSGVAVLGGLALVRGAERPKREELAPSVDSGNASLERKLSQLEQEVRALKRERRLAVVPGRAVDRPEHGGTSEAEGAAPEPISAAEEAARIEAHYEGLDAAFRAETRDDAWARDTESAILALAREPRFEAFSVRRADCAATLCKLEVTASAAGAEVPVEELFHAVPRDRIGGAAVRRVGEPLGNRVVAYFVRKGHDLPATE
ncbi:MULTISPECIES: hypothetical protein [Sorangium]|uniref:Uncharacterized protein n=1 Tax=Sorangium cellulosum TaxID=56 RepID=A0A4P2R6B2_SORCE|nr:MULTISPECIES: hypothetical protein [Sorangium]AUX38241.1 uncharacterized protein SOCE836_104820 [Sorangium cellulosum]WCQ97530.1 hypothetical protein NQZ70_10324 [Sorangium sp. Soce836]